VSNRSAAGLGGDVLVRGDPAGFHAGALARYCLRGGPTWFTNYGLYGMQWGARQLFGAIREELASHPRARLVVSHTWANNPNAFVRFFLNPRDQRRVELFDPSSHQTAFSPFDPHAIYVIAGEEYTKLVADPLLLPATVPEASQVRVSIKKLDMDSYVHLRELKILPPAPTPEPPGTESEGPRP